MMASSALLPSRGRGNLLECSPLFLIVEVQYGERVGTGEMSSMIHEQSGQRISCKVESKSAKLSHGKT